MPPRKPQTKRKLTLPKEKPAKKQNKVVNPEKAEIMFNCNHCKVNVYYFFKAKLACGAILCLKCFLSRIFGDETTLVTWKDGDLKITYSDGTSKCPADMDGCECVSEGRLSDNVWTSWDLCSRGVETQLKADPKALETIQDQKIKDFMEPQKALANAKKLFKVSINCPSCHTFETRCQSPRSSWYAHLKYSGRFHRAECETCGKVETWEKMLNHFNEDCFASIQETSRQVV